MAQYKFYIQKFPQDGQTFPKLDIEEYYKCHYKQFKDFAFDGEVKSVYSEDWCEQSGKKVWLPEQEDLTFKDYDCKLELLFKAETCQEDVRKFYEDIRGVKLEYYDNFRNRYLPILLTKQPSIDQEILYGNSPYMLVSFTFNAFMGQSFSTSQIN